MKITTKSLIFTDISLRDFLVIFIYSIHVKFWSDYALKEQEARGEIIRMNQILLG